ncbi:AAA family ATPase [Listeria booriae]|uniref:ATP-dependent nuclease n=1 Tax=Listeria booriae TaxID=1552123 RepID=UPI001624F2AB|nr:TOPRIM nucleotidyl transferase/hydrolase domain-containing protein [Listeria booriae]MBC1945377.1 AAA family ATPase [Listeria booriae]
MNHIKRMHIHGLKKFKDIDIEFNEKTNILVGENESGKSTILEAINIVLNQQYRNIDKYILKDLMNTSLMNHFYQNPQVNNLPHITILVELELDNQADVDTIYFRGINDRDKDQFEKFGIQFVCEFDKEFEDELSSEILSGVIPFEYYKLTWSTFQGTAYNIMKKPLRTISIDNSTADSNSSFNYFNKSLFDNKYSNSDKMKARNGFRNAVDKAFGELNLEELGDKRKFGVNSKKTILDNILTVYEESISLENKGKGMENLIKTQIALDKSKNKLDIVLLEEPENHLCHSNLLKMLDEIKKNTTEAQLILTTHSNMIASRLDLRNIIWIGSEEAISLNNIAQEDAEFFEKADQNGILNLLLSKKIILVEGPTEYMLLPSMYKKTTGRTMEEDLITVISCNGIAYKRYLAIAETAVKKVAVITDNDGKQKVVEEKENYNRTKISQKMFVDDNLENWTWEVCMFNLNKDYFDENIEVNATSEYLFNKKSYGRVLGKMLNNKTETAYSIIQDIEKLKIPEYVKGAFTWINE